MSLNPPMTLEELVNESLKNDSPSAYVYDKIRSGEVTVDVFSQYLVWLVCGGPL